MTRGELELVMNCMSQILAVMKREGQSIVEGERHTDAIQIAPVLYDWTDVAVEILRMTMDGAEAGMPDSELVAQIQRYLSGIAPYGAPQGD